MDTMNKGVYFTEILHNLNIIAENENLLRRAAKYLRKLAKEQTDSAQMSEEEFFQMLDQAEEEAKKGKVTRLQPGETVNDMLRRSGYDIYAR